MRAIQKREAERGSTLQVILGVIGGLLIVTVLCVFVAVWALKNYVGIEVERSDDAKRVAVHTPIGDVEVERAEDVADRLKLPIYPGAEPADEGASVRVRGRIWGEEGGTNVTAAYFYTEASFDEVDDWYREQLGSNFVRQKGELVGEAAVSSGEGGMQHDWEVQVKPEGDDVVYSHERAGRLHGVVLKREEGRVKFGLLTFRALNTSKSNDSVIGLVWCAPPFAVVSECGAGARKRTPASVTPPPVGRGSQALPPPNL